MQFRDFKDDVKAVVEALAESGIKVQHTVMLDAISKGFGERSWSAHREALQALAKAGGNAPAASADLPAPAPWTPQSGPMTEAQFLAVKGQRCPCCGSDDLDVSPLEPDGDSAWNDAKCGACGAEWSEGWLLMGYSDLVAPTPEANAGGASTPRVSPLLADGEVVIKYKDGQEKTQTARLNLDTGKLVSGPIDIAPAQSILMLAGMAFRAANGPGLDLELRAREDGLFISPSSLSRMRKLLKIERPSSQDEFGEDGLSLKELYSCVTGKVIEQFEDGTTRESADQCLLLNGVIVSYSYDLLRRRRMNDAESPVATRYFLVASDLPQAEPRKFYLEQSADAHNRPYDPYSENFRLREEDLKVIRAMVTQGVLTVGAVELAALLSRMQQLDIAKASLNKAVQSGQDWQIQAARVFYGERDAKELEALIQIYSKATASYQS